MWHGLKFGVEYEGLTYPYLMLKGKKYTKKDLKGHLQIIEGVFFIILIFYYRYLEINGQNYTLTNVQVKIKHQLKTKRAPSDILLVLS